MTEKVKKRSIVVTSHIRNGVELITEPVEMSYSPEEEEQADNKQNEKKRFKETKNAKSKFAFNDFLKNNLLRLKEFSKNKYFTKIMLITGVFLIAFFFLSILNERSSDKIILYENDTTIEKEAPIEKEIVYSQEYIDSVKIAKQEAEILEKKEWIVEVKTTLSKEIKSLKNGYDFREYRGHKSLLQTELALFSFWWRMVNNTEMAENKEISRLRTQLKQLLIKTQIKEFPILRKELAAFVRNNAWKDDIDVYANGKGHKCINFASSHFLTNAAKQEFQGIIQTTLIEFRFAQARYWWYKGDTEYTYFNISSQPDHAPAY